ncbi:protein of unknown function [Magnetospirillum gryphiswaldense MSR-1 v2]|uniref:Uncharacterized protein n=1 Tax=Magnetospirillum gryphiswaldense (strain DSM 6361 / JCM 21280 / NBRC 15271 / MSR-1) TaxID=431944 RepID=V6EXX3_MAGGM|nr:hypothetical protein [Magnetospirillum gryphiswaldense]CDK98049.1 protein of unknown function [Magnetospirillum gryphiswaldense MSR-1 v2]
MISGIDNDSAAMAMTMAASPVGASTGGTGFDAALQAAQKAQARQQAHESEMESIKDKGFTAWVRDTRIEKLKEELRKKVMAEMGLDEDSLAKMEPVIQKILEQKIQEEVEKQLQQALKEEEKQGAPGQSVAQQAADQAGKNDRRGISCPVIPALVDSGGVSIF